MANTIGKDYAYMARVLRLMLLAPEIVHAVLTGRIARKDRSGGPAAVHAGLVVGAEESTRHRVRLDIFRMSGGRLCP